MADRIDAASKKAIASMTDTEFDELVAETRPPKIDAKIVATEALRAYLGYKKG